jgi:hypothetical protein
MSRRKRYKRKPWYPIDPDKFIETRLVSRLSHQDVADMLHVTVRTVQLWEHGTVRIPYAAYKLLRILTCHELPGKSWEGWMMHSNTLWSPAGRGYKAHELENMWLTFAMARNWQMERDRKSAARAVRTLSGAPVLRLVR